MRFETRDGEKRREKRKNTKRKKEEGRDGDGGNLARSSIWFLRLVTGLPSGFLPVFSEY